MVKQPAIYMSSSDSSNSDSDDNTQNKSVKKRGRPKKGDEVKVKPKEKIDKTIKKAPQNVFIKRKDDDDIILRLPELSDSDSSVTTNNTKSGKKVVPIVNNNETFNKVSKIKTILEMSSDSNDEQPSMQKLIKELKAKDEIIKKLTNDIKKTGPTQQYSDASSSSCKIATTTHINCEIIDVKSGNSIVVEKTNVACWWDAHKFSSMPCFIPDRYTDGKYYVFGCFCSYNCALAYNLSLNDNKTLFRNGLIRKLYSAIIPQTLDNQITIAPQKELLQLFGGPLSIDDFRKTFKQLNKEIKITIPPLIPLVLVIEETDKDVNSSSIIIPAKIHTYKGRGVKKNIKCK